MLAITRAVFVCGIGMSMFFDGIVLHQLLQWHHMASQWHPPTTLAGLQINTVWDGVFHAGAWVVMSVGMALGWQAIRRQAEPVPTRVVTGSFMMGWGAFNILENLLNHFILQVHHVRETGTRHVLAYDVAFFLLFGLIMTGGGWLLWARGTQSWRQRSSHAGRAA